MAQSLEDTPWANQYIANDLGGFNQDSILHYFANSHFSDQTSNNAVLISQALYDQELAVILSTGDGFQKHLMSMSGLEYLVSPEPLWSTKASQSTLPQSQSSQNPDQSTWVIRKQQRQKQPGAADGVQVLACYLILNGVITKLPTVGSILSARLSSSLLPLNQSLISIVNLPIFSASNGYSYLPPDYSPPQKPISQLPDAASLPALRLSPPPDPQDGTITPTQNAEVASQNSSPGSLRRSQGAASNASLAKKQNMTMDDLFADSLRMMAKHRGVYMDEHPLVGEPGNFRVKGMEDDVRQAKLPPKSIAAPGLRVVKT